MKKAVDLPKKEILHLAKLANLVLNDSEIEKYSKQLTETIHYVENLDELDIKNVKASASSAQLENVFFEDGTKNERLLTSEEATKNAQEKKNGLFKVGRIM